MIAWRALLLALLLAGCGGGDDADDCDPEMIALPAAAPGGQPIFLVRCRS